MLLCCCPPHAFNVIYSWPAAQTLGVKVVSSQEMTAILDVLCLQAQCSHLAIYPTNHSDYATPYIFKTSSEEVAT